MILMYFYENETARATIFQNWQEPKGKSLSHVGDVGMIFSLLVNQRAGLVRSVGLG